MSYRRVLSCFHILIGQAPAPTIATLRAVEPQGRRRACTFKLAMTFSSADSMFNPPRPHAGLMSFNSFPPTRWDRIKASIIAVIYTIAGFSADELHAALRATRIVVQRRPPIDYRVSGLSVM